MKLQVSFDFNDACYYILHGAMCICPGGASRLQSIKYTQEQFKRVKVIDFKVCALLYLVRVGLIFFYFL